jgi:hypothetical protein
MTLTSLLRIALISALFASAAAAQKYTGPVPPKPDVPYIVHADNLVEAEAAQAKEDDRGKEILYSVEGASSAVRTPLAEPIFLIETQKVVAEKLELYKFEIKRGRREVLLVKNPGKNSPRPVRIIVKKVGDHLYQIEADETLENGEYGLSPAGSNQVFCFQVY